MTRKLICVECNEPVVFRREEAKEHAIMFDVEEQARLDDDPIESESLEGLYCPNCDEWFGEDADEDVLAEIPKLVTAGLLKIVDVADKEEAE